MIKDIKPLECGEFFSAKHIEDVSPKQAKIARIVADTMINSVKVLSDPGLLKNIRINKLMTLVFDLIINQTITVTVAQANTITFAILGDSKDTRIGTIIVPWDWPITMASHPIEHAGGVVFIGSQCCDFYHSKLYDTEHGPLAKQRALAYEAEFLLTILDMRPDYKLSDYQKDVLTAFPQGTNSEPAKGLIYDPKSFVKQDAMS